LSLAIAFATAEVTIRALATSTYEGPAFANTLLLPQSWHRIAERGQSTLARAATQGSYLVYDRELGWTIGPSRRSADYNRDLRERYLARHRRMARTTHSSPEQPVAIDRSNDIYMSSVEGLRSPQVGVAFETTRGKRRVALVGNSFTFGLEVRYEQTWGHQLELLLGPDFRVLNFGVDGYGVDQAYLRYRRDVLSWHPEIVIFGVVDDDFRRTMCVYGFLCFPASDIPFPKPRFVVDGGRLQPLNLPLLAPESIYAANSIEDLPFVRYDGSYVPGQWTWRWYHSAYSVRLLLSKYPAHAARPSTASDHALATVNGELLRSFLRVAGEHGSHPMVVFFPSLSDFERSSPAPGIATEVLGEHGIPYVDLRECVARVRPDERFMWLHYSAVANAAVARCLKDLIPEPIAPRVR
jgi:hypothetical protein